jgi:hypothetical protein
MKLTSQKPQCSQKVTSLATELRLTKISRNYKKNTFQQKAKNKVPSIFWQHILKKQGQNTVKKKKFPFKGTDGK